MKKGKGIALLPIGVFLVLYLGLGILFEPIYRQSAVFGHFGRKEFPWEKTDKAEQLRDTVM